MSFPIAFHGHVLPRSYRQFEDGAPASPTPAPLSPAGNGTIRYNDTTKTLQASLDGAAYVDLTTGAGSSPWTTTGTAIHPVVGTNDVVVGATAMAGTERLRVVGDAVVEGELASVEVQLTDPAAGTSLFYGSQDGSTAPLSPAGEGRLRYNDVSKAWEASVDGGAYAAFSAGGVSPWTTTGTAIHPAVGTNDVVVGSTVTVGAERLRVVGSSRMGDITLAEAGTAHFIQYGAGSTAAVSAASTMRFRYNDGTNQPQVSLSGAAYVDLLTGSGTGVTGTWSCPASVAVGDLVAYSASGTCDKADASGAPRPAMGIVLSKPTAITCVVQYSGEITLGGLTAGSEYWLSTTPGAIGTSAPAFGNYIQKVGLAKTAAVFLIQIRDFLVT